METPIALEISEGRGLFVFDEHLDEAAAALGDILDRNDSGALTPAKFLAALKALIDRQPDFIDGHVHLGYALLAQGKPKLALNACQRGLELGQAAIPAGFVGPIPWAYMDNRPFLRAAHGVALCQMRLRQRQAAILTMERMLAWNPDDNHGIRYLLGSLYLRADRFDEAREILEASAADYPPCQYELGLLLFRTRDLVGAATRLRLGFTANGYIAEILCGMPDPIPLTVWHGTNFAQPGLARDYVEDFHDLWLQTTDAIAFLRWLHMHPKVMAERAAVLDCRDGLRWQADPKKRDAIIERMEALVAAIDDRLSAEIVQKRVDLHGRTLSPWHYTR